MAKRYGDQYGDIIHPEPNEGVLESLKATAAKIRALEISIARSEEVDTDDETKAIEYLEQWYRWDRNRRSWVPK